MKNPRKLSQTLNTFLEIDTSTTYVLMLENYQMDSKEDFSTCKEILSWPLLAEESPQQILMLKVMIPASKYSLQ